MAAQVNELTINIDPTPPQSRFIFSEAPYPAIVAGFGAGKTEALIVRSVFGKLKHPEVNRAFYEPNYDLVRQIAWPRFEDLLSRLGIPYKLLKSPHNCIVIEGHGKIIFRSMEIPSRIIGYEVGDSDVDELDTLKKEDAKEVWRRILSRNRQKKLDKSANTIGVATTPEGFRFYHETWEENQVDAVRKGYEFIRAPSYSNPHLPEGYLQSMRDNYPAHLLDAYIEGICVNLTSGSVYPSFNRHSCHSDEIERPGEALFIGMDFNVGNMSATVHVKRNELTYPIAVNEFTNALDTPDMIRTIDEHYPDRKIYVYPDSTGDNRHTNMAGRTDVSLLEQAGYIVCAKRKNPPIKDRVNSMNAAFGHGYKVNTKRCPKYVKCLEQQAYDDNNMPDKKQGLDHLPDAGGYFIEHDFPIIRHAFTTGIGMVY